MLENIAGIQNEVHSSIIQKQPPERRLKKGTDRAKDLIKQIKHLNTRDLSSMQQEDLRKRLKYIRDETKNIVSLNNSLPNKEKIPLKAGFLGTIISLFKRLRNNNKKHDINHELGKIIKETEALKRKVSGQLGEFNGTNLSRSSNNGLNNSNTRDSDNSFDDGCDIRVI
ncbi:hypothetical protein [Piscirickettsia litoralis]|uniref:Uncharacterized protein n=1 Tax=Piscirickettsia litoralis TaxID=1891921 RepID=A0ABX3A5S0_9GAMM|nr:hypothetical protein [Piscirickettsia litoralis]ODN43890.1 hypothetical protein BGC07_14590 [Piscirickettsia litoralis]